MDKLSSILSPKIIQVTPKQTDLSGAVLDVGRQIDPVPGLNPIVYTLDSSLRGVTRYYIIGDATNMIKQAISAMGSGEPFASYPPSALNGNSALVAPNRKFWVASTILFSGFTIQTSSDPTQFDNPPVLWVTNQAGQIKPKPIMLNQAERNTQYNNLLLTVKAEFKLGPFDAIRVPAIAGEIVTLTLFPKGYSLP